LQNSDRYTPKQSQPKQHHYSLQTLNVSFK